MKVGNRVHKWKLVCDLLSWVYFGDWVTEIHCFGLLNDILAHNSEHLVTTILFNSVTRYVNSSTNRRMSQLNWFYLTFWKVINLFCKNFHILVRLINSLLYHLIPSTVIRSHQKFFCWKKFKRIWKFVTSIGMSSSSESSGKIWGG